jgi:FkbH-like protein
MVLKEIKALRRQGLVTEALDLLRQRLSERAVPPEKLDAAGRSILEMLEAEGAPPPAQRVLLVGQCTTSFLKTSLVAVAHGQGSLISVEEGGYDSVLQDLASRGDRPDVVVVVPWHQRLLSAGERSHAERIDDELAFFRQVWAWVESRGSRLVQVGYDWTGPGPAGYGLASAAHAHVGLLRAMDAALREAAPNNAYFVDLQQISGSLGRRAFYDARTYFWTKQPFSWPGLELLSRHLWAATRALTTGPKKVLVLDLDNTLWGGVVGEEGPLGIRLGTGPEGEAFQAFQKYCKGLAARGVLLAVCSKNNPEDAREPFKQNPDMLLRLEDFAAFDASWDPKSVALERIAETLRLGLESFVFMDDNPAERRQIRMALPMVEVVEAPEDAADFVAVLEDGLYFEAAAITSADRERNEQYRVEAQRREHQQGSGSLDEYLASLQMRADVRRIDGADLTRVAQLIGKTNQFNLTTRRHTAGDVRLLLETKRSVGLSLRLQDRFGDYGLISVVLALPDPSAERPTLSIDTWLMSCRAIARGVEGFLLNQLASAARELGYEALVGEYLPSSKNGLVAEMYPKLGFTPAGTFDSGGQRFVLLLGDHAPRATAVSHQ